MRALPRSAAALGTAHRPATTAATARWRSTARPRPASRTALLPAKPAGGSPAMSRAPRRARSARRPTRCGLPSPLSALLSPASTSCGSSPASSAAASCRAPTLTSSTRKCSSFVRSSAGCLRRLSKPVAQRESARRRPSHERPGYQPNIAGGDVLCHRVRPTMSPARLHVLIFCRRLSHLQLVFVLFLLPLGWPVELANIARALLPVVLLDFGRMLPIECLMGSHDASIFATQVRLFCWTSVMGTSAAEAQTRCDGRSLRPAWRCTF